MKRKKFMWLTKKKFIFTNYYMVSLIPQYETSLKLDTIVAILNKNGIMYQVFPRTRQDGSYRCRLLCSHKKLNNFCRELREVHKSITIKVHI